MYYYHIWLVLRESLEESDCGSLHLKSSSIQSYINKNLNCIPINCINYVNYSLILQCSGGANHRGDDHANMIKSLNMISELLPGSYGLIYWMDDEIPGRNNFDGFNVIVLARGCLTERYDPFLSPIAPTIEN